MYELVDAEKANYPVTVLRDVLEVSRSGYYASTTRPQSARSKSGAQLAVQIAATHQKSVSAARPPSRARRVAAADYARVRNQSFITWPISRPGPAAPAR